MDCVEFNATGNISKNTVSHFISSLLIPSERARVVAKPQSILSMSMISPVSCANLS